MNEIEKMYEKFDTKKEYKCNSTGCHGDANPCPLWCKDCENLISFSPPFTAEKQLDVIKLISKQGQVIIENWEKDNRGFNVTFRANSNLRYITMDSITRKTVEEALVQLVNDIWQDLTEEEKQQIKEILK